MTAIPNELLAAIANPVGPSNVLNLYQSGMQQGMQNEEMDWRRKDRRNALASGQFAAAGDYQGAANAAYRAGNPSLAQGYISAQDAIDKKKLEAEQRAALQQMMTPPNAIATGPTPAPSPSSNAQPNAPSGFAARKMQEARQRLLQGDKEGAMKAYYEAQNGPDSTQQLSIDKSLGDEPATKYFREGMIYLKSMSQSINDDRAVSDLDFIYGTAKMLDPSGKVTDQDAAMASLQQSLPAQLWNYIEKQVTGGGQLGPEVRLAMLELGRRRMSAAREDAMSEYQHYSGTYGNDFQIREPGQLTPHLGQSQNMQRPDGQQNAPGTGTTSTNVPWKIVE